MERFHIWHGIGIFVQDKFCSWIKVIHRGCDEEDEAEHYLVLITKSKICHNATILYLAFHCKAQNTFKSNRGLFLEKESAQYAVKFSRQIPWWWYPTRKPPSTLSCLQKGQFSKTRRKAYSSKNGFAFVRETLNLMAVFNAAHIQNQKKKLPFSQTELLFYEILHLS